MSHRYAAPLLVAAVFAGISCNEVSVAPQENVPPAVVINAPEDGSVVTEGTAIQFRATVADDDSLGDIQSVVWTSSLEDLLSDSADVMPDEQGASRFSAALQVGLHTIEVRVTDRSGAEATDSIGITVEAMDQLPTAEIVTPTAFQEYDLGADIDLSGVVQDPNQAPETLTATWLIQNTTDGSTVGPFSDFAGTGGITTARVLNAVEGNYLATLTATDDDLNEAEASVYFVVVDPRDRDDDEDGWTPNQGDCDDDDPMAFPNNAEVCDGIDNNCDGIVDNKDDDEDRHIDEQCELYDGALPADDCDDGNPAVHPLAPEISDGLDNDCNGVADDSTPTYDNDGDCFCIGPDPCTGSSNPSCTTLDIGDCNDNDPDIDPVDDDNDGASECAGDCNDDDPALNNLDEDTDGFSTCDGDCNDDDGSLGPADVDRDGFSTCDGDCDDSAAGGAWSFPGNTALDVCNGRNEDCDAAVDEDPERVFYPDLDSDGYIDPTGFVYACDDPDGPGLNWTSGTTAPDCDDDPAECGADCFPNNGAADICDGYNQDCDSQVDEDVDLVWYHDADGDSFTAAGDTQNACEDPDGAGTEWVASPSALEDCDDDPAACGADCYPENLNPDICDTLDQDCDAAVDEDADVVWYADADEDGFTDSSTVQYACADPGAGWLPTPSTLEDCDDDPGACGADCFPENTDPDICDDQDQDCDGTLDEDPDLVWYADADLDGSTDNGTTLTQCEDPGLGWSDMASVDTDCDDDPSACGADCYPGNPNPDICDGYDQDCLGDIDEDPEIDWFLDEDGDGATLATPELACEAPSASYLADASVDADCDDDPLACGADCFPGNTDPDTCDGQNQDCDTFTDEDVDITWYQDADGDGFTGDTTQTSCTDIDGAGTEWLAAPTTLTDCDDDPQGCGADCFPENPALDICDGQDQDCDAATDEDPNRTWYHDADADGFTNNTDTQVACDDPDGSATEWVSVTTTNDCDDDPLACGAGCYPTNANPDICDGYDQDCQGDIDEDPDLDWYLDEDGDGATLGTPTFACEAPTVNHLADASAKVDCDDDPLACGDGCFPDNPDPDICDEQNQDCDDFTDEDVDITWYRDADRDGYTGTTTQTSCTDIDGAGTEWLAAPTTLTDCDDGTLATDCGADCFPGNGAPDICDGDNQDCDASVDEDPQTPYYHDADLDGFTNNTDVEYACSDPDGAGTEWRANPTVNDCDDGVTASDCGADCFPNNNSPDICDGFDQDCSGVLDEDPEITWYQDADLDGYTGTNTDLACTDPDGSGAEWLAAPSSSTDCLDTGASAPLAFPGNPAPDICDGINQDCDAATDENPEVDWFEDADGDGFTGTTVQFACADPDGAGSRWQANAEGDCDDNPGACGVDCNPGLTTDLCDSYNNDCDGSVDENPNITWYADLDQDDWTNNSSTQQSCTDPGVQWDAAPSSLSDCNDGSAALNHDDGDNDGQTTCAGDCNDGSAFQNTLDEDNDGYDTCTEGDCNDDPLDDGASYNPGVVDLPDALFDDVNCDGTDGDLGLAILMSPTGTDGSSCGLSTSTPCQSMDFSASRAISTGRNIVYIGSGTYSGVQAISSRSGVDFYGGFDTSWVRDVYTANGHAARFEGGEYAPDGQRMVIRLRSSDVAIDNVVLDAPDADGFSGLDGKSSYGIQSVDSTLTLTNANVLGGIGVSGTDGADGESASTDRPTSASNGRDGGEYNTGCGCDASSRRTGSDKATNPSCPTGTAGGDGGDSGTVDSSGCGTVLCVCTTNCNATAGLAGGNAATYRTNDYGYRGGGGSANNSGTSGKGGAGGPGRDGDPGASGAGGSGGARTGGLIGAYWYAGSGTEGGFGGDGTGGGGGGGGGSSDNGFDDLGGGGGGGGAGGCGAPDGGNGGGGGGGSFGVFAVNSVLDIRGNDFEIGTGGAGGAGGIGGSGQPGGFGGSGGTDGGDSGGAGGDGGDGASGGSSGGGGGGAGGSAYGIFRADGASTSLTRSGNSFSPGSGGSGGSGGTSPTSSSNGGAGEAGLSASVGSL